MNILYISYSCNPFAGSEDKIGCGVPYVSSKTNKVYAIFRSQKNKKLNELMAKYRIQAGMNTVMKGDTENLNKALREKPLLALVTDHYTNDIVISFFGRKTFGFKRQV